MSKKNTLNSTKKEPEQNVPIVPEGPVLKTLSLKDRKFKANGRNYTIVDKIPLAYYKKYQQLVPRLTYGASFDTVFQNLKKAFTLLNEKRFADSAVTIHNIMSGIAEVEDNNRNDSALLICTLIIVRDDEKFDKFDPDLANAKIADWAAEGYDVDGFFQLALISIQNFRGTFVEFIQEQMKPSENPEAGN
jgi:hypothetical protein